MNVVTVTGRVAKPDFMETTKGTKVFKFNLAEDVFISGEKSTQWYRVSLFGKRAEKIHTYINKGTKVTVVGSLKTNTWTKDDKQYVNLDITCNDIDFTNTAGHNTEQVEASALPSPTLSTSSMSTDEIPF